MSLQQRTAVVSLTQSLYSVMQSLGFSEGKMDEIQDHLDTLVAISNDKTKDAKVEVVESVDVERKHRRKEKKDKKDKKEEPVVEPVKAARKSTKKVSEQ